MSYGDKFFPRSKSDSTASEMENAHETITSWCTIVMVVVGDQSLVSPALVVHTTNDCAGSTVIPAHLVVACSRPQTLLEWGSAP
eukprot:scaffold4007_cov164-Amphora_coffeaeformis.AAC.2